jgi:hypothetical protein
VGVALGRGVVTATRAGCPCKNTNVPAPLAIASTPIATAATGHTRRGPGTGFARTNNKLGCTTRLNVGSRSSTNGSTWSGSGLDTGIAALAGADATG